MTWQKILDTLLNFFEHITDFANWLFNDISFNIEHPSNEFADFLFGWLIDLINSIVINFAPIDIFGIGIFVLLIGIGLFKLIF